VPWLSARFVDPRIVSFTLHVIGRRRIQRFTATPILTAGYGIWNDRGDASPFDVMLVEFNLKTEPLLRLAAIIVGRYRCARSYAPVGRAAGDLARLFPKFID